jgi:hypothetical protein
MNNSDEWKHDLSFQFLLKLRFSPKLQETKYGKNVVEYVFLSLLYVLLYQTIFLFCFQKLHVKGKLFYKKIRLSFNLLD